MWQHKALLGLYQGALAAVAVVYHRFARTVALGAALGAWLERSARLVLDPLLDAALPAEYHGWVELLAADVCRAVGVCAAWALQSYDSLLHCAVAGGITFGRALVEFLHERGTISARAEDTYLDEAAGWCVALASIGVQALLGFRLVFPFNVLLSPLLAVDWCLRSRAAGTDAAFAGPALEH